MARAPKNSSTYTTEFRDELEEQRLDLLRRRFLWYCGVIIGLSAISLVFGVLVTWFGGKFSTPGTPEAAALTDPAVLMAWVLTALSAAVYVLAFSWVYRNPQKKDQVFRIVFWLIVVSGVISLTQGPLATVLARPGPDGRVRTGAVTIGDRDAGLNDWSVGVTPDKRRSEPRESSGAGDVGAATAPPVPPPAPGAGPEPEGVSGPADDSGEGAPPERALDPASSDDQAASGAAGGAGEKVRSAQPMRAATGAALVTASGLWSVFLTHFLACCFLPWTPRESMKPIIPLLVLNAVILLFYIRGSPVGIPIAMALSPLVAAPGAAICWYRGSKIHDTFTLNVLKGRYSEIKRELIDARRIHESLFPGPFEAGGVALDYRYEPMRQIGGDYLYARRIGAAEGVPAGSEYTHVVIVDVTGHGISAALTVNRLHGEIDRQLGERPDATPADLLKGLNKYLHHTLANHSVYATALCMRVDPKRNELTWASAGHPPAFLRGADGTVDQLDSTTMVLGACKGDDFDANQQTTRFGQGDSVIAYTDGAIEARNAQGRMLGVAGMRSIVAALSRHGFASSGNAAGANGSALDPLIRAVDEHRFGPIQDDTLLVELSRPIRG